MPSLILSSRYTTDSRILRETAQRLGWQTLRIDGDRVPDWFEPPDSQIALFYTAPHAFDIARQLSRTLLGCDAQWVIRLPAEFLRREIRLMPLSAALGLPGKSFVKHAVAKAFPAGVYDARSLAEATQSVLPNSLVHVAEPVEWTVEYRCFVLEKKVVAISAYRRHGQVIEGHANTLGATQHEISAARDFASSVLQAPGLECPPAFVMDVGVIRDRGWAVVEHNECWASGIYACDPAAVLKTLLRACVATHEMTADDKRWDFRSHYAKACP